VSVKVMSLVWDHYPGGGGELLLALALADWASHDGTGIWASVPQMADKSRQSDRTVQYQLRRMRESGWLQITKDGGGRQSTTYRIPIDLIPPSVEGVVQNLHPSAPPERCNPTTAGVQSTTGSGAIAVAPKPLSKPSSKPSGGAKRPARLSENWILPKAWGDWALTEQPTWTAEHVRKVAAMFKNHWIAASGRSAAKLNWYATWQNWCWKEPALKGATLNGHGQPWFLKASGIEAKAKELGIKVPEGKDGWQAFRDEVYQRAGVTDEMLRAAKQDAPR